MRILSLGITLILLGGLGAAAPTAAPAGLLAELMALLGEAPHGATVTTYTPDGPVVRFVPWPDLAAALEGTTAAHEPVSQLPTCGVAPFCPDVGYGSGPGAFCDAASAWVLHREVGEVSAFTQLVARGTAPRPVCLGVFGPAFDWQLAEMSPLPLGPVVLSDGCVATAWMVHSAPQCPGPRALDSFSLWRYQGTGVAATFDFGPTRLDYFLGDVGVVCRDLPPAPLALHAGCP